VKIGLDGVAAVDHGGLLNLQGMDFIKPENMNTASPAPKPR
jgi:hypothetical protein